LKGTLDALDRELGDRRVVVDAGDEERFDLELGLDPAALRQARDRRVELRARPSAGRVVGQGEDGSDQTIFTLGLRLPDEPGDPAGGRRRLDALRLAEGDEVEDRLSAATRRRVEVPEPERRRRNRSRPGIMTPGRMAS